jgi:hypothetical protein
LSVSGPAFQGLKQATRLLSMKLREKQTNLKIAQARRATIWWSRVHISAVQLQPLAQFPSKRAASDKLRTTNYESTGRRTTERLSMISSDEAKAAPELQRTGAKSQNLMA